MSERSEALAVQVEQVNKQLVDTIEGSTAEQWGARCADGEWTQGFAGYHAATSVGSIAAMVKSMARGEPFMPVTFAQIDEGNAAVHKEHANATREEALALAKAHSPTAVETVRNFSDEELDRKVTLAVGLPEMTVEQVVEMLMVGHTAGHVESISKAR